MNENIQRENVSKIEKKQYPTAEDIDNVADDKKYFKGESYELKRMKILREIGDEVGTERVRDLLNSLNEEGNGSVFSSDEKFDPWTEMKSIRKGASVEENRQRLDTFKKKMAYQKMGIIEMQSILYDTIDKSPNVTEKDLEEKISELMKKYAISVEQQAIFEKGIGIYVERHNGIVKNTKDCIKENGEVDGQKLFEKMFKRAPFGKVEVVIKPITVYLKLSDVKDYAYVESGAYKQQREADDEEIIKAKRSSGAKLINSQVPGMEHTVAIENTSKFAFWSSKKEVSNIVLTHEDQHNFNDVIESSFPIYGKYDDASGDSNQKTESEIENEKNDLRDADIELIVKDEICSYVKDGSNATSIRKTLLKKDTIYKFGENYKKENKNDDEQFSQEYVDLVECSIVAAFDLIKNGYTREEANAFLFPEDILYWPKAVERQLGIRKSPKQELKDRRDLSKTRSIFF